MWWSNWSRLSRVQRGSRNRPSPPWVTLDQRMALRVQSGSLLIHQPCPLSATYDRLAQLQHEDPRLRIHAVSTATADNMDEIGKLSRFLLERCPQMEHHNLAIIRGDRKNPSLEGPRLRRYQELAAEVAGLWGSRQAGRYGSSVEPLLQWAKVETARQKRQVVPCTAGVLSAVVYSNGDVSVCENHEPLGNIRDHSFSELWRSSAATLRRESIRRCECHCTNEVFLWPSIVYQPVQLGRALFRTRIRPARALDPEALLTSATPQAGPLPAREVDERPG